jgi:hypothetical protein
MRLAQCRGTGQQKNPPYILVIYQAQGLPNLPYSGYGEKSGGSVKLGAEVKNGAILPLSHTSWHGD